MTLSNELTERLVRLRGLPSPPRVAMRIIEAARDPNIALANVAEVVTSDPVISAKIMSMANSAAYARPGRCQSLRQALILLGLDSALMIALSFSLVMSLRRDQQKGLNLDLFWRRSLLAATAASALGSVLKRNDRETLFLAGLLQDIGMLAIDKIDPKLYEAAGDLQHDHRALISFEREWMASDHLAIGAWLMERWQLPDKVVGAIAKSHTATNTGDSQFERCVALSGPLAEVWLSTDWSLSFRDLVGLGVEMLDLDHIQLGAILDELRLQIPENEALFEKDLIDAKTGIEAMDEARELLMVRGVEAFTRSACAETQAVATDAPVTLLRLQHRAELREVLEKEFSSAVAGDTDVGVIMAGIDGLDHIRETCGPETADRMLRETALVMLDNTGTRVVGQFAHNELVVWLDNYNLEATQLAGRRILREFEKAMIEITGETGTHISLTLGIVAMDHLHPCPSAMELLASAESALKNACYGGIATDESARSQIVNTV